MGEIFNIESLRWEVEEECNLQCLHCFIGNSKSQELKRLTLEEEKKVVSTLCKSGLKEIYFTTKEPLIHPNIIELIKFCTDLDIACSVVTNGIALCDKVFAEELLNSGVVAVSISLEGATEETNDLIRGKGSFKKAIKGIYNLYEISMQSRRPIIINIQMTLNKFNYKECERIPELINTMPIDTLAIGDISNTGNARKNSEIILSNEEFLDGCRKINKAYRELRIKKYTLIFKSLLPWENLLFNLLYDLNQFTYVPNCSVKTKRYSLMSDGKLVPCISLLHCDSEMVSVEFDKIVSGEAREKEFENYINNISQISDKVYQNSCSGCYFEKRCFLCPAMLFNEGERIKATERCTKAKNLFMREIDKCIKSMEYELTLDTLLLEFHYNQVKLTKYFDEGGISSKYYSMEDKAVSKIISKLSQGQVNGIMLKNEFVRELLFEGFIKVQKG